MSYNASYDGLTKFITAAVTILFAGIIIGQYSLITDSAGSKTPLYITVLLIVIYFLAFAFSPMGYRLTQDTIIIRRFIGDVKIHRRNIQRVKQLEKGKLNYAIRIFGVGGLFGYFGKFANSQLGRMTWYATRRDRIVLIETEDGKKIILSPDEPAKFIADFNTL